MRLKKHQALKHEFDGRRTRHKSSNLAEKKTKVDRGLRERGGLILLSSNAPLLDTNGQLNANTIPNLNATKINAGKFSVGRIPDLVRPKQNNKLNQYVSRETRHRHKRNLD